MAKVVYLFGRLSVFPILLVLLSAAPVPAQNKGKGKPASGDLEPHDWTVDGKKRTALVYIPPLATTKPSPLVFVFHGHGGTTKGAAQEFAIHKHWPAAIVVYMQGVPTPQGDDPQGKKTGWQYLPGEQKDRDVHFFDTVLADLSNKYKVDEKRIFAAGFSNGGGFSIALWSARPDKLAATASVCMRVFDKILDDPKFKLKPKPFLLIAGKDDDKQTPDKMESSLTKVRDLEGCENGETWCHAGCTFYPSPGGTPVLYMVGESGHAVPHAAQAVIVDFFNEVRPGAGRSKVIGDWRIDQPTVGESMLHITEKEGKLEVQEEGLGNAKGTKTVYRDGRLVVYWEVDEDLRGYWVFDLNQQLTHGTGKTFFTRFNKPDFTPGKLQEINGRKVRVVEEVTIEHIGEKSP